MGGKAESERTQIHTLLEAEKVEKEKTKKKY